MNAAMLLMSSACLAGADTQAPPAHAHAPAAAPVVAAAPFAPGACCPAPCADTCCEREGLLARLKARFHRNKHNDCGCAAPVYHGFTTACCDPCERHGWGSGPGLFSRLRGKFNKGGDCCDPCGQWTAGYPGCALPPVPGTAPPPPVPGAPKEMPKQKKDAGTEAGAFGNPTQVPTLTVPVIPTVPASGTRNPF